MEANWYEIGLEAGRRGYGDTYGGYGRGWSEDDREAYLAGFEDGKGERELAGRPVDPNFKDWIPAPAGFEYTGEKRVAQDGEWYLTKNGNAKRQVGQRGNAQTRHILRRI